MKPSPTDVQKALDRVLKSETFVNSPTLCAFLSYVARETLAGRADRLKAYTIAVSALQRDDDFDPNDSALVRVQARRVRDALARYYEGPGAQDSVRIALPVGTYVPEFTLEASGWAVEDVAEGEDPFAADNRDDMPPSIDGPLPSPIRGRRIKIFAVVALLCGVLIAGISVISIIYYYRMHYTLDAHRARLTLLSGAENTGMGRDPGEVLPTLFISVKTGKDAPDWFKPDLYRQRIQAFTQRFEGILSIAGNGSEDPSGPHRPSYRLTVRVNTAKAKDNALLQVISIKDSRLISAEPITLTPNEMKLYVPGSMFETPPDLRDIREAVQWYGTIFNDLARIDTGDPALDCLIRAAVSQSNMTKETHAFIRTCLEKTIAENPRLVSAYSLLALCYMAEYQRGFNPLPGDPLERAEAALQRAIELAPDTSFPYQVLQTLRLLQHNKEAALEAGRRAVEINPENMLAVGVYGATLARVGRHLEAANQLLRAEANFRNIPRWIQFYAFLALNNLARAGSADHQANFLVGSRNPVYLTAVVISAARRGDMRTARKAMKSINTLDPGFRKKPLERLRRQGFADTVSRMLLYDLDQAGFKLETDTLNH